MDANLQLIIFGQWKERNGEAWEATNRAGTRRQQRGAACCAILPERCWTADPWLTSEKKWHLGRKFLDKSELKQLGKRQTAVFTVIS